MQRKVVSVYGYGRFGKLWADILSQDHDVQVYSRRGLKESEVSCGQKIVSLEQLFDCDAMFFCVAISAFENVLKQQQHLFKGATLYFDTCSVKVYPVQWMESYLPKESGIIATHPMFGPDSYTRNGERLPMVMGDIRTSGDEFGQWVDFFNQKHMRVEIMSPEQHDEMVAYSQGITHFVGRVLSDLNLKPNAISTLGYDKLLDIIEQTCNDSWQLFMDLQNYNPYTRKMRDELQNSLSKIYELLEANNGNS